MESITEYQQLVQIKKMIERNDKDALDKLYIFIFSFQDYNSKIYHESLYILGSIFLKKYEETNNCSFAFEALTAFASASNVYLALNGKCLEKYSAAIVHIKNLYTIQNIRTNTN